MKLDQFAFFNQQLAAMLRDGIPLEGALRRLAADLRRDELRGEIEALAADLAQGTPLPAALPKRRLPELYARLLALGAQGSDLPGTLTLVADYYQRQHDLWTRLKGLLVYPVLLLGACFLLSVLFWQLTARFVAPVWEEVITGMGMGRPLPAMTRLTLPFVENPWIFPLVFLPPAVVVLALWVSPRLRHRVLDRLPAFREARLAQAARLAALLLRSGQTFPDTLTLLTGFEPEGPLRRELEVWRQRLAAGVKTFAALAAEGRYVPPLFVWIVNGAGENLSAGFAQAAEIYEARSQARIQTLLYSLLPVAVLTVGGIVIAQAWVIASLYLVFIEVMGSLGG